MYWGNDREENIINQYVQNNMLLVKISDKIW